MEGSESASQRGRGERENVRLERKVVKELLEKALRSINNADGSEDDDEDDTDHIHRKEAEERDASPRSSSSSNSDAEDLRVLIRSRVEGPEFMEKMQKAISSCQQNVPAEEGTSWDMVSDSDVWEGGNVNTDQEDYVVVRQEDIVDGIACFMAAYLLSLEETKDLTPNELQKALCKTFSVEKKKGKLRKALDGSKVIYNVASWSATAIGIYQNPALIRVASTAFWSSCRVISRLF